MSILVILAAAATGGCGRERVAPQMPMSGLEATNSLTAPQRAPRERPIENRGGGLFGGDLMRGGNPVAGPLYQDQGDKVSLNLVDAPIAVAAKTIFADILKKNFIVADNVTGSITLQTSQPVTKQSLVDSFQSVLAGKGYEIAREGDTFRIRAGEVGATGSVGIQGRDDVAVGKIARIVPLKFVSAQEMERILRPLAPAGVLRVDSTRNVVVLSGTSSEVSTLQDAIGLFDVDWMRGMSAGIYPLQSGGDPGEISKQLEMVFASSAGAGEGLVKFLPSKELKSILVVAARPVYLDRARALIDRLDRAAGAAAIQTFVYKVENRSAKDMVKIVQGMVGGGAGASDAPVAPRLTGLRSSIDAQGQSGGSEGEIAPPPSDTSAFSGEKVSVVADEPNNALVLVCTRAEYERLRPILQSIDRMPSQVLIEAVIAEVTLTDELRFGVRWFFEHNKNRFNLSDVASGAVSAVAPGFSYFFNNVDFSVAVNALSEVTNVKVVSSPTLTVLDNRSARLQIGDQVPIVRQSATSVLVNNAPIVNEVELKDTGVILNVTPRVSSSGHILLNIDQEVSDVVRTTTSNIDSPTIRQRKVSTSVVVGDGQSIALGGLVQEKRERTNGGVPILASLPGIGAAFRNRDDVGKRTELMIFLRARVMRDQTEAQAVTDEFRQGLRALNMRDTRVRPGSDAERIVR